MSAEKQRKKNEYKPEYRKDYKKPEETKEVKKFKPSPIISPVYGILDKNYKKEDVVDKKDRKITSSYASKKVDLDTVRRKAFGELRMIWVWRGEDSIRNEIGREKRRTDIRR